MFLSHLRFFTRKSVLKSRPSTDSIMIPITPEEEFQKLSKEEQNAQWDRELVP
jgi:hypothetical protein